MGILYDIFGRPKKRCTLCGCHMYDDSDSDICEVCVDELLASDPGEPDDEESLYPSCMITTDLGLKASEKFREIVNRRVSEKRDGYNIDFATIDEVYNWSKENPLLNYGILKPGVGK